MAQEISDNFSNEESESINATHVKTPIDDTEIRILLIGATGTGKSSTGNTILSVAKGGERELFFHPGQTSDPKTRDAEEITRTVIGRNLTIVDTPGADNIIDDPVEIQKEIRSAILKSNGYDIIIFVLSVLENRLELNDIDLKVINVIETILGEKFWDHGIFLFTHGDNYERLHEKRKLLEGLNYAMLKFEEFVKKNRLAQNKYAIGPQANKVDFVAVKFENDEPNECKRAEMVENLLKKIDDKVKRNEGRRYDKNQLPPEQFVVPKFRWLSKMGRKVSPHIQRVVNELDTQNVIIIVLIALVAILLAFSIWK